MFDMCSFSSFILLFQFLMLEYLIIELSILQIMDIALAPDLAIRNSVVIDACLRAC